MERLGQSTLGIAADQICCLLEKEIFVISLSTENLN